MSSVISFQSPFVIEESVGKNFIILKTCLLREGMSGNGRIYEFKDFARIAKDYIGKTVGWGATVKGEHLKRGMDEIGEVIETWVDENARRIYARLKVWNTDALPRIIELIKSYGRGMGVSIGGVGDLAPILRDGLPILIKTGHGFLARVVNFVAKHVQLIPPNIPRGQQEAQVLDIEEVLTTLELIPIEETLTVEPSLQLIFRYPKGSNIRISY